MLKVKHIGLIFCFLTVFAAFGQTDESGVCRIEDGRLIFRLDKRWPNKEKKNISVQFSLDSLVMANAYAGKGDFTVKGTHWKVRTIDGNFIEISKSMLAQAPAGKSPEDVVILDDAWITYTHPADRESAPFGINRFTRFSVFQYSKGVARFFLPGHLNSYEVILSGTFNNWSTSQLTMTRVDSGWITKVHLEPGKYCYKYIIDGQWIQDPFNRQFEDDTYGGNNSVVFCFNYIFHLYGFKNAKQVFLSGSFNDWEEKDLSMIRIPKGWALPMYLREGTHTYKYIVDGQWVTDPTNPLRLPDGHGGFNSSVGIGASIKFRLVGETRAKKVFLAGDFNQWNGTELEMTRYEDGWELPYILGPGNYEYKFVVDGKWVEDPKNPITSGTGNYTNSVLVVKPNHTFVLDSFPDAKKVVVTGSFNGWKKDGYQMKKKGGKWTISLCLKPGKNLYKFVVDDKWIMDPGNELWENNEFGNGNSVLWIKP